MKQNAGKIVIITQWLTRLVFAMLLLSAPVAWSCDGCYNQGDTGGTGGDGGGDGCGGGGGGDGSTCPENAGEGGGCVSSGQPVSLANGREMSSVTDMVVDGIFPIQITRKYDSQSDYDSPLGYGWALTLDRRLYKFSDGSVVVRSECGKRSKFIYTGSAYQSPVDDSSRLEALPDGTYTLSFSNGYQHLYDAQGKLATITSPAGVRLAMTYADTDSDGRADRLPLIGSSRYAVNPSVPSIVARDYRLIRIEEQTEAGEPLGNAVDLAYNATTGRLTSITDQSGRTVTYTQDTSTSEFNGNLLTVQGLDGVVSTYGYNDRDTNNVIQDPHNVTSIQHNAQEIPYIDTYDAQDRVIRQVHGNEVRDFVYGAGGITSTVTHTVNDADGTPLTRAEETANFDDRGYPEQRTKRLYSFNGTTPVRTNTYRLQQIRDSGQNVTEERWYETGATGPETLIKTVRYTYNAFKQKILEEITLLSGEIITKTWGYDQGWKSFEQVYSSLRPNEIFRTEYTFYFDAQGKPENIREIRRKKADGSFIVTAFTYENGQLKTTTLPDGQKLVNVYTNHKLTKTYFEAGGGAESPYLKRQFGYDSRGNRDSITDALGHITSYLYDDRGRVIRETNANNEETHYTYTGTLLTQIEAGRTVAGQTVNEGQVTALFYTPEGWLERVERKPDSGANIVVARYTYDGAGNRLSQTQYRDGTPLTTTYDYDARGRMVRMTDPRGIVTEYAYDAFDNRTRVTEDVGGANRVTTYQYDALDRLVQITQDVGGLNAVTTMTYDAAGNLLTVTDPENSTTTYTYDRLSRRTAVTQPLTQQVQTFYTTRDQVDYVINARGHKIDYSYFPWGGLEKVEYFNTATDTTVQRTVSYAYDHNGNITNVIDDSIQAPPLYTFTYDVLNRPDQTTVGYLPSSVTLNNDYDRYGNRDQFTLNDGSAQVHSFNYNKLNQLTGATLPGSQVFGFDYYDAAGPLRTLTYPSGITTDYQYEDNGPIKQILTRRSDGTTVIEQLDYLYDDLLNVDSLTSANDGVYDYGYDPLDHLTQADYPSNVEAQGITDETFQYDKVGNRINAGHDYNANHQITQSPGTANYAFDNDGNMISKAGGFTYGYNKDNRLTSFTDSNNSANNATYQYDPFGRRISKTVNGNTTWFLWDGDFIVAEYSNTGVRQKRYGYLPKGLTPIQVEDNNGIYSAHYDHLQTPKFLTNSAQQVVWSQIQTVFGEVLIEDNPDGDANAIIFNARFPGQWADVESALYYNYRRDYSPNLGRYIERDPIGLEGGYNLYLYATGNPQINIDFLGLKPYPYPPGAIKCAELDSECFSECTSIIDTMNSGCNEYTESGEVLGDPTSRARCGGSLVDGAIIAYCLVKCTTVKDGECCEE